MIIAMLALWGAVSLVAGISFGAMIRTHKLEAHVYVALTSINDTCTSMLGSIKLLGERTRELKERVDLHDLVLDARKRVTEFPTRAPRVTPRDERA